MLSEKLSKEIISAADELSQKEFANYLQELECDSKIELNREGYDTAIGFATFLVDKMRRDLDSGEWFGYELKALQALEELPCDEHEIIKIDAYGFPAKIEDNDDLLDVMGVSNLLAM